MGPKSQTLSPAFAKALKDLDRGMVSQLTRLSKAINASCDKVELRINKMERSMVKYVAKKIQITESELQIAEILVKKELRSKMIMSQWTSSFLAESHQQTLDPITFAFARFSLNVAICYNEVPPAYFIKASVHILLISLCSFDSDLVVGPALLGLAHLSLLAPQQLSERPAEKTKDKKGSKALVVNPMPGYDENVANMKASIVDAGMLPKLLPHMIHSTSLLILAQACKLCASLALYFPNKPELARSGCFHSLLDLVQGVKSGVEVNESIQYAALCAVVNITNGADANKNLAVELQGIKPLLITIRATDNAGMIMESCKALANISYCNSFTSAEILSQAGDVVVITLLETTDIIRQSEIVHVALSVLSNLCNSEVNQSHVGAAKGCVDLALRVIQFAREPYVVAAAANLLLALVLRNKGNKARCGAAGIPPLMARFLKHTQYCQDPAHMHMMERLCMTITSIMLYEPNQTYFHDMRGLAELVRVCKTYSDQRLLAAIAPIIIVVMPSPEELKKFRDDEFVHPVDQVELLPVLKKIRLNGYGHLAVVPNWIDTAIALMVFTTDDLGRQPHWYRDEFVEKLICFREFSTEISPDTGINNFNHDTRGLIFSVY